MNLAGFEQLANGNAENSDAEISGPSPGSLATYRNVLAVLQSDYARTLTMRLYRAAGYSARDFARCGKARAAMADALSYAEDALELRGARRERGPIRAIRRRLETEVPT